MLPLNLHLQFNGSHQVSISLPIRLADWMLTVRALRYPHRFIVLLIVPVAALAECGTFSLWGGWGGNKRFLSSALRSGWESGDLAGGWDD